MSSPPTRIAPDPEARRGEPRVPLSMGRTRGVALVGMEAHLVEVEADIGQSLPAFVLLGLPDASLRESQDRIRSAAKNTGLPLVSRRLTVNLLPASLPKSGSGLDLAILMSAWAADGHVAGVRDVVFLAEVGLDGRLRPVRGVLLAAAAAVGAGMERLVVSSANAAEANLVPGIEVIPAETAREVAVLFRTPGADPLPGSAGVGPASSSTVEPIQGGDPEAGPPAADLHDVRGQLEARFALEVAAAGRHHLLLIGAPGAGKTMLASRLPGILPLLEDSAAMETTAIASITGPAAEVHRLRRRPPFEAPHHSASAAAIVGGGVRIPRPGAITRAHHGVLFLDEATEFSRQVLDSLRQPLESGRIVLQRSAGSVTYPAQFQLVLASNPCPCGMNIGSGSRCTCSVSTRRNYLGRLSGPLLDRIDLQVQVERPRSSSLALATPGEGSSQVLARVTAAREAQRERLAPWALSTNAEVPMALLSGDLRLERRSTKALDAALDHAALSLRGYVRVLRLAWTLADLAGLAAPRETQIDAAMQLRQSTTGD